MLGVKRKTDGEGELVKGKLRDPEEKENRWGKGNVWEEERHQEKE